MVVEEKRTIPFFNKAIINNYRKRNFNNFRIKLKLPSLFYYYLKMF